MSSINPILKTKFTPPQLLLDFINRDRIIEKADNLKHSSILLISAPSGYGKSLFVSSYIQNTNQKHGWLSLSEFENDFNKFATYFILAIQQQMPHFASEIIDLCNTSNHATPKELTDVIVNELAEIDNQFIITLDDYHLIRNVEIHNFISRLFEYPQKKLKLILITRRDPPLPLSHWRLKNLLTEIRVKDLKFNKVEIQQFLSQSPYFSMNEKEVENIERISEGWISGLRLLNIAIQQEGKLPNWILEETLTNSTILYEMTNELLNNLDGDIKQNLLLLSFVPKFNFDLFRHLCLTDSQKKDATGRFDQFIDVLVQNNLFIVELDNQKKWYRLHHLFQDLLKHAYSEIYTIYDVKNTKTRIADWYINNMEFDSALKYYLEADQLAFALNAFKSVRKDLLANARWQELENTLNLFNKQTINKYSLLKLTDAWISVYKGNIPILMQTIPDIEALVEIETCDEDAKRNFLGEINVLNAYYRYNFEIDMQLSEKLSSEAINQLNEDNLYPIGLAWIFYGGSMQALHRSNEAKQKIYTYLQETENFQIKSNIYLILCYIYWLDGDLKDMKKMANHLIRLAKENMYKEALANGYYFSGLANFYLNLGKEAQADFTELYQLKHFTLMVHRFFGTTGLIFSSIENKNTELIENLLTEIEVMAIERGGAMYLDFSKAISSTVNWIYHKDPSALDWANRNEHLPFIPMTNFTSIPLLQTYILASSNDKKSWQKALIILKDTVTFLKKYNNSIYLIRAYILQSLVYYKLKESDKCEESFILGFELALPRNLAFPFKIFGDKLLYFLQNIRLSDAQIEFLKPVIENISKPGMNQDLSSREEQILQLIGQHFTNKEIGEKLFISEKTVKRHVANIYKKIGAENRTDARKKAKKLELV